MKILCCLSGNNISSHTSSVPSDSQPETSFSTKENGEDHQGFPVLVRDPDSPDSSNSLSALRRSPRLPSSLDISVRSLRPAANIDTQNDPPDDRDTSSSMRSLTPKSRIGFHRNTDLKTSSSVLTLAANVSSRQAGSLSSVVGTAPVTPSTSDDVQKKSPEQEEVQPLRFLKPMCFSNLGGTPHFVLPEDGVVGKLDPSSTSFTPPNA
jgi:hypothetical protein